MSFRIPPYQSIPVQIVTEEPLELSPNSSNEEISSIEPSASVSHHLKSLQRKISHRKAQLSISASDSINELFSHMVLSSDNAAENKRKSKRTLSQLSPRGSKDLEGIFSTAASLSAGGAHEFESTLSLYLKPEENSSKLQEKRELTIDEILLELSKKESLSLFSRTLASSKSSHPKIASHIQRLLMASQETFNSMTALLNEHRLYPSYQEKKEPKRPASHKSRSKKFISKSESPKTILEKRECIAPLLEKLQKIKPYISSEKELEIFKKELSNAQIADLNTLYFILTRIVSISHQFSELTSTITALHEIVDEVLSLHAMGISKLIYQESEQSPCSTSLQRRPHANAQNSRKSLHNTDFLRTELLNGCCKIQNIERSEKMYGPFLSYISHSLCEAETAKFLHTYREYENLFRQYRDVKEKQTAEKKHAMPFSWQLSAERSRTQHGLKNLRQLMNEGKQQLNINGKKKLETLASDLKKLSDQLLTNIKNGEYNIQGNTAQTAESFLKQAEAIEHQALYKYLHEISINLKINCESRLNYTQALTSYSEYDNVFLMSEPFFRLCSEYGIPVFTHSELKKRQHTTTQ